MNSADSFPDPSTWILYVDADLVVVNKPSGLLSIPDGYHPELAHHSQALAPIVGKLWIVHRLDRETSGVVLLARNAQAHRKLNETFRQRSLQKNYRCLAAPIPSWDSQDLHFPLRINADRAHRTRVDFDKGKPAQTFVRVLQRGASYCLMECAPRSGYTHQIRAHLYHAGIGILGDPLYRPKGFDVADSSLKALRTMLHAYQIVFSHPTTNSELIFTATYPPDFEQKITEL